MSALAGMASPTVPASASTPSPIRRLDLGGREDRLYFAQVREDPLMEIEALRPERGGRMVVVSSGGCTALSLLARGATHVTAVDLNAAQNHLVELKVASAALGARRTLAFLGAGPAAADDRLDAYQALRPWLGATALAYWDARPGAVAAGVLNAGASEHFIRVVVRALRLFVHRSRTIRAMLRCTSLAEQRAIYDGVWNSWRWRALFGVFLSRWAFSRAYDPAFFRHVENPSFARHFLALCEHALRDIPVATNYFLHHMLAGYYPAGVPGGVPPYLSSDGLAALRARRADLALVDGGMVELLRLQPAGSIDAFALSNICEWMTAAEIEALFTEVVRTAAPGARLVFRNFVGWTEIPPRWRDSVVEDRARGEALIFRDRSVVQRRIAVCRVGRVA